MFKVDGEATLTIKDTSSKKNGYIFHDGQVDDLGRISIRNVIQVEKSATLNLESGTIKTGSYKNVTEWGVTPVQTVSKHIWGTGVIVNGGIFNMYGGLVEGSGNNYNGNSIINEAGIKSTSYDSIINIFDGNVTGYNGAPALLGTSFGKWIVTNGKFKTTGSSDSYIWGNGPLKVDAAPVGVTSTMIGNWSQISKSNKSPIFNSTDLEVLCVESKPKIASQTTTELVEKLNLKINDTVTFKVSAVGGKVPYDYLWQIKRAKDSDFTTLGYGSPRKKTLIATGDVGAQVRCIVTDANGNKVTSDVITINAKAEVSEIRVNVNEPIVGNSPSYKATSQTTGVNTGNVNWYDATTGDVMKASDKFKSGGKYKVGVYIYPADSKNFIIPEEIVQKTNNIFINNKNISTNQLSTDGSGWIMYEFPALPGATVDPGQTDPGNTDPGQTDPGQTDPETGYVFPFVDVLPTDWFYESVKGAHKMGLIDGMTPTTYVPYGNMTYAQAIKLAACMNQRYNDGKVTLTNGSPNWYDSYVAYCMQKGIINQNYASVINNNIDRQTYAYIFANALPAKALKAKNSIPDNAIPDVKSDNKYYKEIYTLYRAGICNGNDEKGTFNPNSNIRRSEVAAILIRMMDEKARVGAPSGL